MKVTCIQTNPDADQVINLKTIETMLARLEKPTGSAAVVLLPEVFAVMGSDQLRKQSANHLGDGLFKTMAAWAKSSQHYLIAGTHAEIADDPHKVFNTSTAFDPLGRLINVYRKVHLFNLRDQQGAPLYCESDVFLQGNDTSVFTIDDGIESWKCMTIICYDLRFPETIRREIARSGPLDIVFVPAAFTHQTGRDHWETLLRARAIENQCYVVACNQTGFHSEGRKRNWGHSMVIDPWGQILITAHEEVGMISAELSKDAILASRVRLPALTDRVFTT